VVIARPAKNLARGAALRTARRPGRASLRPKRLAGDFSLDPSSPGFDAGEVIPTSMTISTAKLPTLAHSRRDHRPWSRRPGKEPPLTFERAESLFRALTGSLQRSGWQSSYVILLPP